MPDVIDETKGIEGFDEAPVIEAAEITQTDIPSVTHTSDTIPPIEPFVEQTPEERQAEKEGRINALVARVLPAVKARKIGHNVNAPWLSNPHVDETVRATIEALYELEFAGHE